MEAYVPPKECRTCGSPTTIVFGTGCVPQCEECIQEFQGCFALGLACNVLDIDVSAGIGASDATYSVPGSGASCGSDISGHACGVLVLDASEVGDAPAVAAGGGVGAVDGTGSVSFGFAGCAINAVDHTRVASNPVASCGAVVSNTTCRVSDIDASHDSSALDQTRGVSASCRSEREPCACRACIERDLDS